MPGLAHAAVVLIACACGSRDASPPTTGPVSVPLTAADVAPCILADKPFPNSYTKPHDEPTHGQSFQGITCDGEVADVQIFDFGEAAEAARQASLLREHLGLDAGRTTPSYSPFAMMTGGGRLALIASPGQTPLVRVLAQHGFVDITHVAEEPPRHL